MAIAGKPLNILKTTNRETRLFQKTGFLNFRSFQTSITLLHILLKVVYKEDVNLK